MPDSNIANNGGPGAVNSKKFKKAVQKWGALPEKERRQLVLELTRGLSDKHAQAIQEYFKRLSETQRTRKK
jgi:monoamine oxidase